MARKNRRIVEDLSLPPIKEEWRSMPRCSKFPSKAVFTTGYRAQEAIDEIQSHSKRVKIPKRVYDCKLSAGGCGYYHITSQDEEQYRENHNVVSDSRSYMAPSDSS